MDEKTVFILVVIGCALLAIGFGVWQIMLGRRNRALSAASVSWPAAAGTVLSSVIATRQLQESGTGSTRWVTYYTPAVRYVYEVAGVRYEANTIQFGDLERNTKLEPEQHVARYPAGAAVKVRYDPGNPSIATLETIAVGGLQIALGVGLIAVGCIVAAMLLVLLR